MDIVLRINLSLLIMKCIFWNIGEPLNFSAVIDILKYEIPDMFFLAEMPQEKIVQFESDLKSIGFEYFLNPGCTRITIIKKIVFNVNLARQATYYSCVKEITNKVYVIAVHLPSQMYQSIDGLKSFFRRFRSEIDSEIGDSLTENILIIGDFNVSPFEKPMIDFDGFSASNSVNLRNEAVHLSERKSLYYNPTWLLYGTNHFPGTKYFKRPSASSFDILEHHFLDQVLLSYQLRKNIQFEKIRILEKTNNFVFFNAKKNKICLSDHLPLIYEYKFA